MNTERAVGIIGRSILTAAAMGGGEQVADATYKAFISPSREYVQILNPTETDHFLNKGLSFISIASAQSNLAELCKNVVIPATFRYFEEANGEPGYQEGKDKDGPPIRGAKVQWKVNGVNVGAPMTTDDEGMVKKGFDPQPCNNEGHPQGFVFKAQTEATTPDGITALRTLLARNGYTDSSTVWLEKPGSKAPAASPTVRPAVSPTPDTRPAAPPAAATAPVVSPPPVPDLSKGIDDVTKGVAALAAGVDKISGAWKGQTDKDRAQEVAATLKNQLEESEKINKGLKDQLDQSQQESKNKSTIGMAGAGLGLLGVLAAVGVFLWARRRHAEAPPAPAPAPAAGGGDGHAADGAEPAPAAAPVAPAAAPAVPGGPADAAPH